VSLLNEDPLNEPTYLNERPNPHKVGGELRQAKRHHAPDEVIAAYQSSLATDRAERALRKILNEAPPLTWSQIAQIRAVLADYAPEDES
jgi:hypothetical protein